MKTFWTYLERFLNFVFILWCLLALFFIITYCSGHTEPFISGIFFLFSIPFFVILFRVWVVDDSNVDHNTIDKFPARLLRTVWGRVLYATTVFTTCILTLIGGVILLVNGLPREKLEKNNLNTPIAASKIEDTDTSPTSALPPLPSFGEIEFSQKVLDANETATLSITIKNHGPGDARDLTIHLKSDSQELSFPDITKVPTIPKKIGKKIGEKTINIEVKGKNNLPTGQAKIEIYLDEPHFDLDIDDRALTFSTRKLRTPKLVMPECAIVEKDSADRDEKIDVNEIIELQFYLLNKGTGIAEDVEIHVKNEQTGVIWLKGLDKTETTTSTFPKIDKGKHEVISHPYIVNKKFQGSKLVFKIEVTEKHGDYGFIETKRFDINKKLKPLGEITTSRVDEDADLHEPPQIEKLPPLQQSGNTLWILLVIVVCCGLLFLIIWKRRRRGKQTKPSDPDQRQKDAYKAAAGRKESIKTKPSDPDQRRSRSGTPSRWP